MKTAALIVAAAAAVAVTAACGHATPVSPTSASFTILVFSKTDGFRHDSIPAGIAAVQQQGRQRGFTVEASEDAAVFGDDALKAYKAVVFLSTTGDVLNGTQQAAFERFIRAGGGFVG